MIRRGVAAATVVLSVLSVSVLSGCGGDADGGGGSGGSEVQVVEVTLTDGEVTPDGDRVEVSVGQPVDIVVTADEPGELHVHSSPETYAPFEAGENEPVELQFDRPGLVDIELHEPFEGPVVQLEVS